MPYLPCFLRPVFAFFVTSVCAVFSLTALADDENHLTPATIFIAGDSTAATYNNADHQGWGAVFQQYFDDKKVTVDNRAKGGRSTRTFIAEGWWDKLLNDVKPGDIVLIQFGHNDASPVNDDSRARGTLKSLTEEYRDIHNLLTDKDERVFSFGHYIRQMVADVRQKKAIPVLLSLTARNIWHGDRIERGSGEYGGWMHSLAMELHTPFIDVTNAAADQLEALGKEDTAALYPKDHTHFHTQGAKLHAEVVVAAIKGMRPSLSPALYSEAGNAVTANNWTFVNLPVVQNQGLRSVFMVGDSTVRNGRGDGAGGQWGWGDFIAGALPDANVNFVNRAVGGLSSRTFVTGGHWQRALNMMKPGDIVLLQFGHNDAGALNDDSRARGTIKGTGMEQKRIENMLTGEPEVVHTYGWYLRKMIGEAKAQGVIPVICSPVPRKKWEDNGFSIARARDSYPQWAEAVARTGNTAFIDLHELVASAYDGKPHELIDSYFGDAHTHTSKEGAEVTAAIVAERLKPMLGL